MSKSRMPLYLALAGAGAGGYYLYRAGGDVDGAKKAMKSAFRVLTISDYRIPLTCSS